jgi:hypothetical protein
MISKPRKHAPTIKQRKAAYNRFNREWAEKILRSPEKHPPYMVTTARNVLKRLEGKRCQDGPTHLPMSTTES